MTKLLQRFGITPPPLLYIGGSDVLPPPLPRGEEEAAIAALQTGSLAAKQKLIEHNLRLVVYIARRFENTGVNLEDLISIGTIGLIKAVSTFQPAKNIKLANKPTTQKSGGKQAKVVTTGAGTWEREGWHQELKGSLCFVFLKNINYKPSATI